jgi:hypothetical protein
MVSSKTTRALVIDDQVEEAAPVIQALQLLGMTSLFYDGGADFPLPAKVSGPRLLFLDMVLGEHGARADDSKSCFEVLLGALGRSVDFDSGPFLAVAWTAHPDMVTEFQEAFKERFPNHSSTIFLPGTKPSQGNFYKQETLNALELLIKKGLSQFGSVGLLMQWECLVSGAAKEATDCLWNLGKQTCATPVNQQEVLDQINLLCGSLAFAEGGIRVVNGAPEESILSLFTSMQSLVVDQLEHPDPPPSFAKAHAALIKAKAATVHRERKQTRAAKCRHDIEAEAVLQVWNRLGCDLASMCGSAEQNGCAFSTPGNAVACASKLNSMLLISTAAKGRALQPGTLYAAEWQDGSIGATIMPAATIIKDSFLPGKEQLAEVVLIECSPVCDFAQSKRVLPRCVAAVLATSEARNNMPGDAEFLRFLGPVIIPKSQKFPNDPVWLVVNSHFVTTLTAEILRNLECLGRLRTQPMADVMSWLAGHMARPGYATV